MSVSAGPVQGNGVLDPVQETDAPDPRKDVKKTIAVGPAQRKESKTLDHLKTDMLTV